MRHRRPAFTLIEMLTVIAVVAVLIALLLPALSGAKAAGRTAYCASNLHQLRIALNADLMNDGYSMLPPPDRWVAHVFGRDAGDAAICPSDGRDDLGPGGADNVVIRQRTNGGQIVETTLDDLLQGAVVDDQVSYYYGGQYEIAPFVASGYRNLNTASWSGWVVDRLNAAFGPGITAPDDVPDHVGWVTVDGSAMVTFEFGAEITVTSHRKADFMDWGGSDHWVLQDGEVKLQLGGRSSSGDTGSFSVAGGVLSYGMNDQVQGDRSRGGQLLLLDYHKIIADRDASDGRVDDLDEQLAPRHAGGVNALRVDGSVGRLSAEEAASEGLWAR